VSDSPPDTDTVAPAESTCEQRAAEAAAIRRRWITLGEALAVIAVVISGLTLFNSWSERSDSAAAKQVEAQQHSAQARTLVLGVASARDDKLVLRPGKAEQLIQSQTVVFPTSLGAAPAETTGEPRIEADWFASALKKARNAAGLPDESRGDERLPVAITTRFLVDGKAYEDIALYDIGYSVTGKLLLGHTVALRGLSLVSRARPADAQMMLNTRWSKLLKHGPNDRK